MLQGNLLTFGTPSVDVGAAFERLELDDTSWIDVARGMVTGADEVMAELVESVAWRTGRRRMYDRVVDDPRLSHWCRRADGDPHPTLASARAAIERRYGVALGGVGLNLYRDGNDSVAFHRDRDLRTTDADTLVAIVTLGSRRPFRVRPFGGGASFDLAPASGDLVVMGGRCQRDWEHGVPKTARPVGARLSASWRWAQSP
ncbi:MAG: alpha-ketoglutarate-dependent dioxygenase AlkB [Acidimicrobiales bacterium]